MKRKQAGVSLSGLLVSAVLIAVIALVGMRVIPLVIEYYQIVKAVKIVSNDPNARSSVAEARKAFDRHATVDNIASVMPQDLEITKEGNELVISFAYEKRVPLFANVSLLLDFQGSSRQ
jgi:hypothetical protein